MAFVRDELDDQGRPNIDGIIDIDGRQHIKHLVTRHVEKAMTVEVHTIDTCGLSDPHNNDDDNMNGSDDGVRYKGIAITMNQIEAQKMLGLVVL